MVKLKRCKIKKKKIKKLRVFLSTWIEVSRWQNQEMRKTLQTLSLVTSKVRGKQQSDPHGMGIVARRMLKRGTKIRDTSLPCFCPNQEAPTKACNQGDKYISVPKRGHWRLKHSQGCSWTYYINQANQPPHYKKPNIVLQHMHCGKKHTNKGICRDCRLEMKVVDDIACMEELVWLYKQL